MNGFSRDYADVAGWVRPRHAVFGLIVIVAILAGYGMAAAGRTGTPAAGPRPDLAGSNVYRTFAGRAGSVNLDQSLANGSAAAPLPSRQHARAVVRSGQSNSGLPSDIIRTANMTIGVGTHHAARTEGTAESIAARFGGYVVNSSASGRNSPVTLDMRVPSANFSAALKAIRKLGTVKYLNVTGQDVSLQVVDLHARLQNLQIQRNTLQRLFNKAQNVNATIKIENVLNGVQYQIEQTQGQINYLANRVALSTISLTIVPKAKKHVHVASSRIANAFGQAGNGIANVVAGTIVVVGYALPLAAIMFGLYGVFALFRRLYNRRRNTVTATQPA
ncbi:MAG TPA: DUF4349 domain-containing protein [Chloroflexota bacterium]|jgi:hypothetical protein|nr:DUF4349 domain-containing protein [Chloroflexota bacterium]